jgi:hypothetical protein
MGTGTNGGGTTTSGEKVLAVGRGEGAGEGEGVGVFEVGSAVGGAYEGNCVGMPLMGLRNAL